MTVRELIEELERLPQGNKVLDVREADPCAPLPARILVDGGYRIYLEESR